MSSLNDLVRRLQLAARKERSKGKQALLLKAAQWIWDYACQGEDEKIPMPCPDCGSHSTDCGCD